MLASLLAAKRPRTPEPDAEDPFAVQLRNYLTNPPSLPLDKDPVAWWRTEGMIKWPAVAEVPFLLASSVASSAGSERIFSVSGAVMDNRHRLRAAAVKRETIVQSNKDLSLCVLRGKVFLG